MKIGFVGLGKLGLPCALAIESKGHEVKGYDLSPRVDEIVRSKELPYREVGVQELLEKSNLAICDLPEVVNWADLIFVAVQTPHESIYEGDEPLPETRSDFCYEHLVHAVERISHELKTRKPVVIISTVLPGTIRRLVLPVAGENMGLCYNPFFIAMGTTVNDFLYPEFVLFGKHSVDAQAVAEDFYRTITDAPFFSTTIENAELIKVAYNTFIGMKVVFANTLMEICHKIPNTDVDAVTDALFLAKRRLISPAYMRGGMGDGGGCHPRDNIAMSWLARELNLSHDLFTDIMQAREDQTMFLADLIIDQHRKTGLPIMLLGQAYKPETNLTIGSPASLLHELIAARGYDADMYDPFIHRGLLINIPRLYFISTRHEEWRTWDFPSGSVVIDPWRYLQVKERHVKYIPVGRGSND